MSTNATFNKAHCINFDSSSILPAKMIFFEK